MFRAIIFLYFLQNISAKIFLKDVRTDLMTLNNEFFNVLNISRQKNLVRFPLAIIPSLSLISYGTKGNTFDEISNILLSLSRPKGFYGFVGKTLYENSTGVYFYNHVFFTNRLKVKRLYLETLKRLSVNVNFENLLSALDYKTRFFRSISDHFNYDTRALIIARIKFKNKWKTKFSPSQSTRKFYITHQDKVDVPMMNMNNVSLKYISSSYLQSNLLEIPLVENRFSMIFILPFEAKGLRPKLYDTDKILATISKMKRKFLRRVSIPKFRVHKERPIKKLIHKLQIKKIFSPDANLHRISPEHLYIKEGLNAAFIKVDELGVKASSHVLTIINRRAKIEERVVHSHNGGFNSLRYSSVPHLRRPATKKLIKKRRPRVSLKRVRLKRTKGSGRLSMTKPFFFANKAKASDEFIATRPFAFLLFDYRLNMILMFGTFSGGN